GTGPARPLRRASPPTANPPRARRLRAVPPAAPIARRARAAITSRGARPGRGRDGGHPRNRTVATPLSADELRKMHAYWRAANYLSVGQIYLLDNPLLKVPLKKEHVKPRLLGHWGTTPGLNFLYVHVNRLIRKYDLDAIYVTGPGHGGPGLVANT